MPKTPRLIVLLNASVLRTFAFQHPNQPPQNPNFKVAGRFSQIHYNWALLNKLLTTDREYVERFLEYKARLFRDSEMWLKDLRFLIKVNWESFCEMGIARKFLDIQGTVQILENKYDSNAAFARFFARKNSIDDVRLRLMQLKNNYDVQMEFLLSRKQEYLNDRPPGYVGDGAPFDRLADLEMQKLKDEKDRREQLEIIELQNSRKFNKLITDWSVHEIGCFFRIQHEAGLIKIVNKTEFYKCAASMFRSKNSDAISWRSFKNSFEAPIGEAVEFWYESFAKIMEVIRRHRRAA